VPDHLNRSDRSRIEALEARLAAAEARIATLEATRAVSTIAVESIKMPETGPTALGKDATCSYCGGALWVCRGVHNVC